MEWLKCLPRAGWAARIFLMALRIRHVTAERADVKCAGPANLPYYETVY